MRKIKKREHKFVTCQKHRDRVYLGEEDRKEKGLEKTCRNWVWETNLKRYCVSENQ